MEPINGLRGELWQHLGLVKNKVGISPWMLSGDFNVLKHESEKGDGMWLNCYEQDFVDCVNNIEVMDLPFSGCFFTWNEN
jgi:hypothetical protein